MAIEGVIKSCKKEDHAFSDILKQWVYDAIYKRRDIRRFLSDPSSDELLTKVINAGHQAGSVGLMLPWNFLIIQDPDIKSIIKKSFLKGNIEASKDYTGQKQALYPN